MKYLHLSGSAGLGGKYVQFVPTMKSVKTGSEGNSVSAEGTEEAAAAVNSNDPKMPLFDRKVPDYEHLNIEPLFLSLIHI